MKRSHENFRLTVESSNYRMLIFSRQLQLCPRPGNWPKVRSSIYTGTLRDFFAMDFPQQWAMDSGIEHKEADYIFQLIRCIHRHYLVGLLLGEIQEQVNQLKGEGTFLTENGPNGYRARLNCETLSNDDRGWGVV